jgi:hypothetical protein
MPNRLARRLRVPVVSRTPGRLRNPPLGHYDPCARSSLTAPVHRGDKRGPELRQDRKVCREPQQGAERRKGRRIRPSSLGGPGDGPHRETGHGCGVPHQRLSALCPLIFSKGAEEGQRGTRRPPETGRCRLAV